MPLRCCRARRIAGAAVHTGRPTLASRRSKRTCSRYKIISYIYFCILKKFYYILFVHYCYCVVGFFCIGIFMFIFSYFKMDTAEKRSRLLGGTIPTCISSSVCQSLSRYQRAHSHSLHSRTRHLDQVSYSQTPSGQLHQVHRLEPQRQGMIFEGVEYRFRSLLFVKSNN